MSDILNRSFRLGKAYVDRVRDTIEDKIADAEKNLAKDELDRDPGDPETTTSRGYAYDNDPDALMRRAEERIAAARRAADSNLELARASAGEAARTNAPSVSTPKSVPTTTTGEDPNAKDYRLLGLEVGSDFAAVQAAYEKLTIRCDPRRFPDGSAEQKESQMILSRVNDAFENLRKRLNPMENRFGKLELE